MHDGDRSRPAGRAVPRRAAAVARGQPARRPRRTSTSRRVDVRGRPRGRRRGPTSCTTPATCASRWPKEYGGRGLSGRRGRGAERGVRPRRRAARDPRHGRVAGRPVDHRARHRRAEGRTSCRGSSTAPTATARASPSPTPAPTSPASRPAGVVDGDEVVITGQKVWTSGAQLASMMFCLCRTDPDAPKHRGISYVLVPMQRPDGSSNGFELRPIRQITGTSGFTETFITEARAPLFNVIGGLHNGWRVTMTTLGQRAGRQRHDPARAVPEAVLDASSTRRASSAARTTRSCASASRGRTPTPRSCASPGLRTLSEVVARKEPGPGASINKMFWSEYARDLGELGDEHARRRVDDPPRRRRRLPRSTAGRASSSPAARARSGAARRRCSATSSASVCSACRRSRATRARATRRRHAE